MQIHYLTKGRSEEERNDNPAVSVALGYFDGVHQGHQRVIQEAKAKAKERGVESAVLTFHPHPKTVLGNDPVDVYDEITPLEQKIKAIESVGVDHVFVVTFDRELSSLSPQQFVDTYLIPIHAVHVVAGFDYSYGKFGKGSMETMPEHSKGRFTTSVVEKWEQEGEKVSSTRIRQAIKDGQMRLAQSLLTRPYQIDGKVIRGDQRGRELGFPTANLSLDVPFITPSTGVYVVDAIVQGRVYPALCNVGYLPTFFDDRKEVSIEVYLLDFDGDLYEETMIVQFYKKLRDDVKFSSADALVAQMKDDEKKALEYFKIS
ncbi:riboflavin biosynthesis protein RibF [Geomicrobium sp. JCM 19038]|uniref:riboflavin biosynthesis protein RibF n=1 Tax=Geomicrobium sp. JCM 19038 TaxID=1460635 RepID=UPI00045F2BB0|nr:riboflavin biosynthesis protein RibF [Geomicrobium sp. JCM 19038]GAK07569.1 riboflavin kinase [Geomicrobium sp. JCM 19038]